MTSEAKKGGLPSWAKILIGATVVVLVGVVALVVGVGLFFGNMVKQAQDPAAIARVARSIATFSEPLPAGYKFSMGIDIAGIKTVTVEHQPEKQMLIVMSFPKKEKADPQTLVNELYERGVNTPQASAKFQEVKTRGTEKVAGQQMPYIIGTMTDRVNNRFEGLVGCIVSPTRNETIFVYGIQPPGSPYNFDVTRGFLQTIKSL